MQQTTGDALKRRLLASPAAVGLARTYVGAHLRRLGYPDAIEDAQLIAAELVTNAARASGPWDTVVLFLGEQSRGLVLAVWDGAAGTPSPGPLPVVDLNDVDALPDDPGGWGLHIVRALSREVWMERPGTGPGKWVCASLNV
ncbi:Anti-sigma regulatory factor (Ser/Thr protein kinase) [Thermomonospora echinospora]|uniref:Anti-sigma regulatory factor (Ser/Thr protein kinase) n=1 Tax=Thermomonospora echinospora TaxID=1992 RepID=A0A1H5YI93_9ACTN|nr:ATP-binding protein [Thermomonospora echinospora]SEG23420.1 Anti-sigma regulatory factor (Ser/Thr protein kinase) [Thermomonospora echinospora]